MPNLGELKERTSRFTSGMFTDTFHIADLINDAQNQLMEGARLRGSQILTLSIGVDTYPLTANFKSPGQLVDATDPNSIIPYEMVGIAENRAGYAIEGGNIIIKPVPQEVKTLTHYYYKYATRLEDAADIPEVDAQYHDLLALYAAGMILLLPQLEVTDKSLSDRYLSRWEDGKRNFMSDMQRKTKSSRGRTVNNW